MCYEKPEKEGAEMRQGVVIGRAAREIEVVRIAGAIAQEVKALEEVPAGRSSETAGTAISKGIAPPTARSQSARRGPAKAERE